MSIATLFKKLLEIIIEVPLFFFITYVFVFAYVIISLYIVFCKHFPQYLVNGFILLGNYVLI
nr:MAG TPA: hypothetical protein [Caudoviricetes sp.]